MHRQRVDASWAALPRSRKLKAVTRARQVDGLLTGPSPSHERRAPALPFPRAATAPPPETVAVHHSNARRPRRTILFTERSECGAISMQRSAFNTCFVAQSAPASRHGSPLAERPGSAPFTPRKAVERPGSAPSPPEPVQTPHHGSDRDGQMDHLRLHRDQIHPGLPLRRLGSFDERIGACSEKGCTVTKTLASLKPAATAEGIHPVHPGATFNQRHLRRKVVPLEHFH